MDEAKKFETLEDLEVYCVAREFRKRMYGAARGSLQELIDDLNVCIDENYLPAGEVETLQQHGWRVSKLIGGYIRHLRKCKSGENPIMRDTPIDYRMREDDIPM